MGKNFSATRMETVFLTYGAVMEKRTVRMAATKSSVMEPYAHVTLKQNFPARPQVQKMV